MTRTTSIVLLSIITAIVLFLGVFAFVGTINVGEYEIFYSPATLIQKSNVFTDSVKANFIVELDEDVGDISSVQKIIKARLRGAYGYYSVSIDYDADDNTMSITLPVRNDKVKAEQGEIATVNQILRNVVANGNIEILSSTTYSAENVVLTQEHFRSARVRSYVSGSNTWYLVEIKLTNDGVKLADNKIGSTSSLSSYFALDGSAVMYYDYSGGRVRLYSNSIEEAKMYASYINNGTLNATFTDGDPQEEIEGSAYALLILVAVLFVASVVFLTLRYRDLGLVASLGQLIAVVAFALFAGLVHLEMINVGAAIGIALVYAFMTFFTVYTFDKINASLKEGKTFTSARYKGFITSWKLNLIAHGALLLLGIILWVIPTAVTAPIGNVLVYGAILSFAVTFGLNRLFTYMLSPFHEGRATARNNSK